MENFLRLFVSVLVLVLLSGCETLGYYWQAAGGQFSLLLRARPVADLLADPSTPAWLRERLVLARDVRDYSVRELKLPDNASYRRYAELNRPYAVWNVVSAPEFSVEPQKSCFPVAGCVSYRGFFAQADADQYAAEQRAQGLDVFVYGVAAYSTLGRFDDPLLSTFIRYTDAEFARLVFHELAHQIAYVRDDSTFNESFAVAVEREGLRRWLAATGRDAEARAYAAQQARSRAFAAAIEQTQARLKVLYRERIAPAEMRERKRAELAVLKRALSGSPRYKDVEPNNALLASFATYTVLVDEFEFILKENNGDLERFYAQVKRYAASEPSNRGPLSAPSR